MVSAIDRLKAFARAGVQGLGSALMEPDAADDADLLRAHGAGDAHAFGKLYDRYDRPCFLFLRRLLGPAHSDSAEDLHQFLADIVYSKKRNTFHATLTGSRRSSHSQTTSTRQPSLDSLFLVAASRSTLPDSFSDQNFTLFNGCL